MGQNTPDVFTVEAAKLRIEELEKVGLARIFPLLLAGTKACFVIGNMNETDGQGHILLQVAISEISGIYRTFISTGTSDYSEANRVADEMNAAIGLSVEEACRIIGSSMVKRVEVPSCGGVVLDDESLHGTLADSLGAVRKNIGASNSSDTSFDNDIEGLSAIEYTERYCDEEHCDESLAREIVNVYLSAVEAGGEVHEIGD